MIDGKGGTDLVRYDRVEVANLAVDLATGKATGTFDGAAFSHTLTSIEWIRGSFGNDILKGTDGNDRFETRTGNDTIEARGGDDRIDLALGNHTVNAGAGNDQVNIDLGPFGSGVLSQAVVGSKLEIQRGGLAIAELVVDANGVATVTGINAGAGLGTMTIAEASGSASTSPVARQCEPDAACYDQSGRWLADHRGHAVWRYAGC